MVLNSELFLTDKSSLFWMYLARTTMLPPLFVNLIALETRFCNTCCNLFWSVQIDTCRFRTFYWSSVLLIFSKLSRLILSLMPWYSAFWCWMCRISKMVSSRSKVFIDLRNLFDFICTKSKISFTRKLSIFSHECWILIVI